MCKKCTCTKICTRNIKGINIHLETLAVSDSVWCLNSRFLKRNVSSLRQPRIDSTDWLSARRIIMDLESMTAQCHDNGTSIGCQSVFETLTKVPKCTMGPPEYQCAHCTGPLVSSATRKTVLGLVTPTMIHGGSHIDPSIIPVARITSVIPWRWTSPAKVSKWCLFQPNWDRVKMYKNFQNYEMYK